MADLWQSLPHSVLMLDPLVGGVEMRDEGAANHMRLGSDKALPGIHIFVYGDQSPMPQSFYPRQTRAACEAIARLHKLPAENTFYLKQHPDAIDGGAFHNDVVAASHHDLLLHHELAFYEADETLSAIEKRYAKLHDQPLRRFVVESSTLPLPEAVQTYLFNSQIVSTDSSDYPTIICPAQVMENERSRAIVQQWCSDDVFAESLFVDLRQSMSGGGGPACLRLRLPLTEQELESIPFPNRWTPELHDNLCGIVRTQYPTSVTLSDLSRLELVEQASEAESAIRGALKHR